MLVLHTESDLPNGIGLWKADEGQGFDKANGANWVAGSSS
jgi:hypothetical protein